MAIRTKKYFSNITGRVVRVAKITDTNLTDLVAYICRNGGGATGHFARPEFNRPARIRIKQITQGLTWSKMDWRVAHIGDYIIRYENDTYIRVKAVDFPIFYTAI